VKNPGKTTILPARIEIEPAPQAPPIAAGVSPL
jgi:hypothetical protein